jgi:hypothetical protein
VRTADSRWTVVLEQSEQVDFALYVRDVLEIRGARDDGLPPVDPAPAVSGRAAPVDRDDALAADWSSWWSEILARRRRRHPSEEPEGRDPGAPLPRFATELRDGFVRWHRQRDRGQGVPTRELLAELPSVVAELEGRLGRSDLDFTLLLTEVPVAEAVWTEVAVGHVLVSRAALTDWADVRRRLTALLERL